MRAWHLLAESVVYAGFRRIVRRRYRLPDGAEADYEVIVNPDTVAVLASTADERVILARQFRPGPQRVLDELPGGVVDEGEDPLAAARRELLEETGYEGELTPIGSQWAGAYSAHRRHGFVATGCTRVAEPDAGDEHIEVVLMPLAEFREHLRRGELTDAGLAWAGLDALGLR